MISYLSIYSSEQSEILDSSFVMLNTGLLLARAPFDPAWLWESQP